MPGSSPPLPKLPEAPHAGHLHSHPASSHQELLVEGLGESLCAVQACLHPFLAGSGPAEKRPHDSRASLGRTQHNWGVIILMSVSPNRV